jgi:uncharacterized protein YneF (UPF0154 family)
MSIEWTIILSLVAMIIGLIIGVSISRPTINS